MAKAQGALEYLVIISVAISILAVVTFLSATSISTAKSDYSSEQCREAASSCKMSISGNPSDPCVICNESCVYSNGTELYPGAVSCCKLGRPADIYEGTPGCTLYIPSCGNNIIDSGEQCDGAEIGACTYGCTGTCTCEAAPSFCLDGTLYGECSTTLPLQCDDGILVDKCSLCDCSGTLDCNTLNEFCGSCTFGVSSSILTPIGVLSNAIGDIDGDGSNEVVLGLSSTTNELRVYDYVDGAWVETNISDPGIVGAIAIGDADNDGENEIVVGLSLGISPYYVVRLYELDAGAWVEKNISAVATNARSIAIGDVNGDGFNEVWVGYQWVTNNLRMYEYIPSAGAPAWKETNISNPQSYVYSIAIGDADNDGVTDVVIGLDAIDYELRRYYYSGGIVVAQNLLNLDNTVRAVAIGDADNDGLNEIAYGGWFSSYRVRVLEEIDGVWTNVNVASVWDLIYSITIGDADNDGLNEIVTGGTGGDDIRLFEKEDGVWQGTILGDATSTIYSVAIGDADNLQGNELIAGFGSSSNIDKIYSCVWDY